MSRYGSNFYSDALSGLTFYGETSGVVFDTSPFIARSTGYGEITLSWTRPSTGSNSSIVRLVRNSYGYPESPTDGDILFDLNVNSSPIVYTDRGLSQGIFYYYALFATDNTGTWGSAGIAFGVSTRNWGLANDLWDLVPSAMKTQYYLDPLGTDNDDMKRFVSLFGFELDVVRTEIELLEKSHNVDFMNSNLLSLGLAQMGMSYEPSVGAANNRKLLRNAGHILSKRGTSDGFLAYINSLTGWRATLQIGVNQMLSINDSSFEQSAGNWAGTNRATVTRVASDVSVSGYLEAGSPSNFPNGTSGYGRIDVIAGSGTPTASTSTSPTKAIPVQAGSNYTANCRFRKLGSTTRTISLSITYYSATGASLGTTTGTGVSVANTSDWTSLATVTATAPANAVWASIGVSITSGATGDSFGIDAVQFGISSDITSTFQDARLAIVNLYPNRQNYIYTPSFRLGSIGSWVTSVGTLAIDNADSVVSTKCLTTSAAVSSPTFTTASVVPLTPGTGWSSGWWNDGVWNDSGVISDGFDLTYTASAWVKLSGGTLTGSANVTISQIWDQGSTYTNTVSVPVGTWTRISVTSVNNGSGYTVSIGAATGGSTTLMKIDGILMEKGTQVLDFFDGSSHYSNFDDAFWYGTPYASESLLYVNRQPKYARLRTTLKDYLPEARPFRLQFAKLT